jgi:hypothetical protein
MAVEKNLLSADFTYITDAAGEYVTITEDYDLPRVTPKTPLVTPGRPWPPPTAYHPILDRQHRHRPLARHRKFPGQTARPDGQRGERAGRAHQVSGTGDWRGEPHD